MIPDSGFRVFNSAALIPRGFQISFFNTSTNLKVSMYVIGKLSKYNDERRVVQYSQIDSIGISGDKKGVHWYTW